VAHRVGPHDTWPAVRAGSVATRSEEFRNYVSILIETTIPPGLPILTRGVVTKNLDKGRGIRVQGHPSTTEHLLHS